jgi:hypothetical protein
LPVAVDAGTGVEGGVAAHAAMDRVQGGHQPAVAVTGPVGSAVSLVSFRRACKKWSIRWQAGKLDGGR